MIVTLQVISRNYAAVIITAMQLLYLSHCSLLMLLTDHCWLAMTKFYSGLVIICFSTVLDK